MNQLLGEPYTAYIGIDWASSKHDICLQLADGEERVFERIKHTPEAIEEKTVNNSVKLPIIEPGYG